MNKKKFYTYAECKAVAQENNVKTHDEYRAYRASSDDERLGIPTKTNRM